MTEVWVALAALAGIVALLLWGRGSARLLSNRRSRLPRRLELEEIPKAEIPEDAEEPLAFLTARLADIGFTVADRPALVPALQRFGHRVIVVPFVHELERAYFLMGIEAGRHPKSQLVLHIISMLEEGGRVETTTLEALGQLRASANVYSQVVLDAETIEEIWSRHRLALTKHRRESRAEVSPGGWNEAAQAAYEGWVQSAVRAQRLQLDSDGEMYRVRARPRSVW